MMNRQTDRNQSQVVIKETYDPVTGKLIEKMSTKIDELEKTVENNKTETHQAATQTASVDTSKTATETASSSTKIDTSASSTVKVETKDKTEITPAGGKNKRDMRFTVGVAYHDNKVKPVAGYSVTAFGIGSLVSVHPGILAGSDLFGGAVNLDIMSLPRLGVGYGCNFKAKKCKELFALGIRLDF